MTHTPRNCALVVRYGDAAAAESAVALAEHLRQRGVEALVPDDGSLPASLPGVTRVPEARLAQQADLFVALGGDGTLLYAAGLVAERGTPLLGINRGRLGFLTDVLPEDMFASVDAALAGQCVVDRRALLRAQIVAEDGRNLHEGLALNDVVLQRAQPGHLIDFETAVNERYVNSHGGDGLVVSTATGSTAYALSCGGPIVEPQLDVLLVTPICPHTLSDRPIVVSGRSVVSVRLAERAESGGRVSCDGRVLGELGSGQLLRIRSAEHAITLLHPQGYDYYKLLRSKLHWGRRSFDAPR